MLLLEQFAFRFSETLVNGDG